MPYANTGATPKPLEEISRAVAPGAHAMVILDQAGWHTTRKLKVPKNLTTVSLPPACPELNAAENIWQYLRQTYLSNRVFKSYTDILDACQEAWQKQCGGDKAAMTVAGIENVGVTLEHPVGEIGLAQVLPD